MIKRILKHLIGALILKFLWHLFSLFRLIPKQENLYAFTPRGLSTFVDNVKYSYLYAVDNAKKLNIEPVLLSTNRKLIQELREKGYPAEYIWSLRGFYALIRAKYLIRDYTNIKHSFIYSVTRDVQIWHGVPLKRIEWDMKIMKDKIIRKIAPELYKPDILLVPSKNFLNYFMKAFRKKDNVFVIGNYPRNLPLVKKIRGEEINACICNRKGKKIIYMPTFRTTGYLPGLIKMVDSLGLENTTTLLKLHPNEKTTVESSSFVVLEKTCDVYPLLRDIDLLITDYSSIFFDFSILNKPIILFIKDYDRYTKKERGLIFDPQTLGLPLVTTIDELKKEIKKNIARKKVNMKKIFDFAFDCSPQESIETMFKILKSRSK